MSMNRRQILAGAAATAAVAAMPAVAIGAAAKERDYGYLFYLDPDDHEWRPGRHLWAPEFVTIGGCWHLSLADHDTGDAPSDLYISGPVILDENEAPTAHVINLLDAHYAGLIPARDVRDFMPKQA